MLKKLFFYLSGFIFLLGVNMSANATADNQVRASYIQLTAQSGKETDLADFLGVGAQLVSDTEPETLLWSALQSQDKKTLVIFDTFGSQAAQDAHFSGKIPEALSSKAHDLVQGGWNKGVVPNINNADIIAFKTTPDAVSNVKIATFIPLTAKAGQEENLANFLKQGAQIVKDNEPDTLHWFAIHFGQNKFGIVDFFPNQAAVDHHFAGGVAQAMQQHAATLVEGGWENGVVAGIQAFSVIEFIKR
ncbi:hypothetical protein A8L45_03545 [Veronia pacifica]|uniref:Antibiotic biosynthesis monooxygenase n=1 Tax=Veronia pacifica TaxID=1080227 RepID=A0A1C3ER61_9GAMM|nr:hypothetical protein A8L45_03545 [Veronia pacifica]